MLYIVTLTFVFEIKYFLVMHLLRKKNAQTADVAGRFASTRTAPDAELLFYILVVLFSFFLIHLDDCCYNFPTAAAAAAIAAGVALKMRMPCACMPEQTAIRTHRSNRSAAPHGAASRRAAPRRSAAQRCAAASRCGPTPQTNRHMNESRNKQEH